MKNLLLLLAFLILSTVTPAQVLKRLGDRAKNKMEQKAGDQVDKKIDEAVDGPKKVKTDSDGDVKIKEEDGNKVKVDAEKSEQSMSYTSKYDFVPGEKVIAFEDFSNTEIGDFPTRWNTNATAEVVTINGKEGKWMKFNKQSVFQPEFITSLPENFTLEFDVAVNTNFSGSAFVVNLANLVDVNDFNNYYHNVSWRGRDAIHIQLKPGMDNRVKATSRVLAAKDGNYRVNNNIDFTTWDNIKNNFAHVSLWRQNTRLRIYVNGEKIWDIPRAFDPASKYNGITFAADNSYRTEDYYVVGNIRLAIGAADTRNKLITEGKFVTHGILFDVNSDKIKPESYGALKDIGNVLKENPSVKVKIVGHTDSDGEDKANMDLSKRRAAAVKTYLVNEFGVTAGNIETDGKGESVPVDKNTTAEGKANNRRVEFIKI
jgi:OOP family OmpA-OmpF porin